MSKDPSIENVVSFLYEVGTLRKIARSHRQVLFTDDLSDNIASHSFRVGVIAYFLALLEHADPHKALAMGIFHDIDETRSGDQNWIHKKYTKVFEEEILEEQTGKAFPMNSLSDLRKKYKEKKTQEAILTKDADYLDQILLLREYEWQGNKEAIKWLKSMNSLKLIKSDSGKKLAREIYAQEPSTWWNNLWQIHRR